MIRSQNIFPRSIDLPFSILTVLGSAEIVSISILSIFFLLLLRKKRLFLSLFLFGAIFVIEIFGKLFIYHPIPPPILNRNVLPLHLPSSFIVHTNYSFPSGHVSRVTFICIILLFLISKKRETTNKKFVCFGIVIFVFLILIAVSRVYLGEHWGTDVVGGILLGGSISTLSIALW